MRRSAGADCEKVTSWRGGKLKALHERKDHSTAFTHSCSFSNDFDFGKRGVAIWFLPPLIWVKRAFSTRLTYIAARALLVVGLRNKRRPEALRLPLDVGQNVMSGG